MLDRREQTELARLARAELPRLTRLAQRLGGVDADELVQDTMVRACRSYGSLRDDQAGLAWLRAILTNVWRDRLRARGRSPDRVPFDDEQHPARNGGPDGQRHYESLLVARVGAFSEHDVHLVLDRLPQRYRLPLVLRYLEGYDTAEVADLLDRPVGTVMSQLHRGRRRFEHELCRYADESGPGGDRLPGPSDYPGGIHDRADGRHRPAT